MMDTDAPKHVLSDLGNQVRRIRCCLLARVASMSRLLGSWVVGRWCGLSLALLYLSVRRGSWLLSVALARFATPRGGSSRSASDIARNSLRFPRCMPKGGTHIATSRTCTPEDTEAVEAASRARVRVRAVLDQTDAAGEGNVDQISCRSAAVACTGDIACKSGPAAARCGRQRRRRQWHR